MKLTVSQRKKAIELLKPIVMEVKRELSEESPLNNWKNGEEPSGEPSPTKLNRPQQIYKLGMNKLQFLPSGGLALRTAKATITLTDEESKKLASMIVRIMGK